MTKTPSPNWLNQGSAAALPGFIGLVTLIYLWNNGAIGLYKAPNVYAFAAVGLSCGLLALAVAVFVEPQRGTKLIYAASGIMIVIASGFAFPASPTWALLALLGGMLLVLVKAVGFQTDPAN